MKLPQLLGLAGNAGVGKDTLADYLVREHGYVKYRFADPLKKLIADRFGLSLNEVNSGEWRDEPLPAFGYSINAAPGSYFSLRSWMQWLGTEVGRTIGGPDVWVNATWAAYKRDHWGQRMVVCDLRFDNEAASFWSRGGEVLNIVRPGAQPVLSHASERGISVEYISCQVANDDSVESFLERSLLLLQLCQSAV